MFWKRNRNCKHTSFKFEADFVADPIWCNDCGENLDIEDFPLSENLREALLEWGSVYGKWIKTRGNHNEKGFELFQEVRKLLGEKYPIIFVPSKSAKLYNILKNN